MKLSEHVKAYVKHTAKTNTTAYRDLAVLNSLIASVGDRPIDEVSPFHIERWKQERAEDVSRSTVNRDINIIRGCFSRAVEWGRLTLSPLRSVKSYKVDDNRIRVLTDDELQLVLCTSADGALICRVTLVSLNRISEVLALRRERIGSSWMEVRRKGGRVDRIALPTDLRASLLARCHKAGFVFGEGSKGESPTLQTASNRVIRAMNRIWPLRRHTPHDAAHGSHTDARGRHQSAGDSTAGRMDFVADARTVWARARQRDSPSRDGERGAARARATKRAIAGRTATGSSEP